ncbi:glycosyltransferase [Salix suchowensis]|nr:glycosyltransferase [Salix suchowensis]
MDEGKSRGDLHVNVVKQSPLRQGGSLKSTTLSGRSTPRNSPTHRLLHSGRTPRREGRGSGGIQWFRSTRLIYWLLLITLWTYLGFYVQSRWAHGDNKDEFLGFGGKSSNGLLDAEQNTRRDLLANDSLVVVNNGTNKIQVRNVKKIDVVLAKKGNGVSSNRRVTPKKKSKRGRRSRVKARDKQKAVEVESDDVEVTEPDIPRTNASYGLLVGPFGPIEDRILEWSPMKRAGTCDRKGAFARLVWSRKFVLIFHELSMTGAPLSMLELATEFLSCGATVSAVVLSKKGGLMPELVRRRIKVLEDRADLSFKTAMKADLIIAGSAVCTSWIDQYIARFPAGGSQVVWWIMENRREYFDRSKIILNRVKMVFFLSESQMKQWLIWCEEENIRLRSPPAVVQLSVNDELAFVAGIACSLNTPSTSTEKMLEKRQLLRESVRKEMGLTDNDMLVMSLSSINAGKGQLMLLESANLVVEPDPSPKITNSVDKGKHQSTLASKHHLRALLEKPENLVRFSDEFSRYSESSTRLAEPKKTNSQATSVSNSIDYNVAGNLDRSHRKRKLLADSEGTHEKALKVLIGSVGSKSNKVPYVKEILRFTSQHSNLSKSVLWTPATTRVASLYSAADVYIINSQGLGETFGRVTIEAMAFGLPVLGTDAGGSKEIVEHNITGLLHPVGRPGTRVLAQNIEFLLKNPSTREHMGIQGRKKVEKMYLKRHMYKKFGEVLYKCMRVK